MFIGYTLIRETIRNLSNFDNFHESLSPKYFSISLNFQLNVLNKCKIFHFSHFLKIYPKKRLFGSTKLYEFYELGSFFHFYIFAKR